ncbi:hypothetical protein SEA_IBANTIK_102 [Streptomyces phage Ibantik]|uniref:Uncharacterized protein n=1 Tax=Streptomyces phage Ibantik TaxID=2182397 RepID=A0A2U8UNY8_9CAUD|nr:hypothetical protein QEH36_gp063 [Streptomyces phage Ibantik]AWN05323.1 hypothetical protein SEA_IBANTIK_102 [Streptomyces phage Ibantik]
MVDLTKQNTPKGPVPEDVLERRRHMNDPRTLWGWGYWLQNNNPRDLSITYQVLVSGRRSK